MNDACYEYRYSRKRTSYTLILKRKIVNLTRIKISSVPLI